MNMDRILSNIKDYHLPIVVLVLLIGTVLQWFHRLDSTFITFATAILGAVMGHAFSPARRDDPPTQP